MILLSMQEKQIVLKAKRNYQIWTFHSTLVISAF